MSLTFQRLVACAFPVLLFASASACGSVAVETNPTPDLDPLSETCGAAAPEPGSDPLVAACRSLIAKRTAYEKTCAGFGDPFLDEKAAVDSCVGIATAPGSTLSAAEIESCAAELCLGCTLLGYPSCLGNQPNLLYPNHDKKGTGKPGEACAAHLQCDSGYCSAYGDHCGHCEAARALFDTCTGPFDLCVSAGAGCVAGTCELLGTKEGESCIDYGGGDCQPTLFCKVPNPDTIDGVCAPRGAEGTACARDEHCVYGTYCNGTTCTGLLPDGASCQGEERCAQTCIDGTCAQPELGLHENDDCIYSIGCGHGLACENEKCIPQPYAAQGAACSVGGGLPCGPGLTCDAPGVLDAGDEDLQCVPMPQAGDPCTAYAGCGPESVCVGFSAADGQRGTCTQKAGEGQPCPCGDDLACVNGSCVPFGAAVCN